jgi:hypothetical protein
MRAVLLDAIRCFTDTRPGRRRVIEAARAQRWIEARDRDWPFSFERICEALDIEPDDLRRRLRAGRAAVALAVAEHGVDPRRPPVDSTLCDGIVRMLEQGYPPRRIAATYGTTIQAVSRLSRERARHVAVARNAEVRQLRGAGWSLTALAARFGLSRARIVRICRLDGRPPEPPV